MLKVKQFRYSEDNLGYLVYGESEAMAIDGGAPEEILDLLSVLGVRLKYVTNTHSHYDHTPGNLALLKATEAKFLDYNTLIRLGKVSLEDEEIKVVDTPGHSYDSVCFFLENPLLISGDTLFTGNVGKCFTGDLQAYFYTMQKLIALPPETLVYPGHDYVEFSTTKGKRIDPGNSDIDTYLAGYNETHIVSSMETELRINPFLRFNDPAVMALLKERELPGHTSFERFKSLMSLH